ncbi:hypothetical protein [Pandoravirus japonicus]|uniref:Uncharacterized protein n=1 Tax=Pandoravirus japonicus TaxID=2823154 RepID=A0A811BRI4_9VIRU|nr:hypothetical protein [Pandoravirus japonicus]
MRPIGWMMAGRRARHRHAKENRNVRPHDREDARSREVRAKRPKKGWSPRRRSKIGPAAGRRSFGLVAFLFFFTARARARRRPALASTTDRKRIQP